MNVFVLCTGRCGSETFARACSHMTNYTASHESNNRWRHPGVIDPYRSLRFPPNHIEIDNRLSWFLGALDKEYGADAYYVHLTRPCADVAASLLARGRESILYAFAAGILQYYGAAERLSQAQRFEIAMQYCRTIELNIGAFLKDKPRRMTMCVHEIQRPFKNFWDEIGAAGDVEAALREWDIRYNATPDSASLRAKRGR
jgi:hypothetical protein